MKNRIVAALLCALTVLPNGASADPVAGRDGKALVELTAPLTDAPMRAFWQVEFVLTDADGAMIVDAAIAVSGGMPAHGHGLPTAPQVEEIGGGHYVIKGLKFSMPGEWELVLDIVSGALSDRVLFTFEL